MKTITLKVDTNSLISIVQHCNLGRGCFSDPIKADSFAELECINEIPENTTEIEFKISNNGSGPTPTLSCVTLENVCKKDINLSNTAYNRVYDQVFDCSTANVDVSNRQLCITAEKKTSCTIFLNKNTEGKLRNSYFSYTAIFTLDVNGVSFSFSIDPMLDLRSKRPTR